VLDRKGARVYNTYMSTDTGAAGPQRLDHIINYNQHGEIITSQGLPFVRFSAQREHSLSHLVGCFVGFSDKNGSH
jgi:hypothetical protein